MLRHTDLLRTFVGDLAGSTQIPGFRNPYQSSHAAHNLFQFLSLHDPSSEALLLVGEAPGYRGAAVSGVPFTSLAVLEECDDPWGAFGHERYRAPPTKARSQREATATMVWGVLREQLSSEPLPLTWNAVPFHPIGSSVDSNRPVRQREVKVGAQWLERLLGLFPRSKPIAIGRTASIAMTSIGVQHAPIRHPSHGGFRDFQSGIEAHSGATRVLRH